jgi:hypothetical protein
VILKTFCIAKERHTIIIDTKLLLYTVQIQGQVVSRNGKQEVFSMLPFWRQLHNKYTTAP